MNEISLIINLLYQYADSFALLILSAIGLIVIFGMMGVINMAHGEMMMIGAYITSFSYYAGVPTPIAVAAGGLGAGLFGLILERTLIRRFYGQLLSSLVVTWGLSLILTQGALILLGSIVRSVPTPFGSFSFLGFSYSYYRVFVFFVAIAMIAALWLLFGYTRFGVRARATMEDPEMALALGVNTSRIYTLTFGLGTFLAGISGGLLALTSTVGPFYGLHYTPQAFITVVVGGGADIIGGLLASALILGGVRTAFTSQFNILLGYVAMLFVAIVIIRFMPSGISDWIEKRRISVGTDR